MSSLAAYRTPHLPGQGPLYIVVSSGEYDDTNTGRWYYGEYLVMEAGAGPWYGKVYLSDTEYENYVEGDYRRVDLPGEALRAGLAVVEDVYGDALSRWTEKFHSPWREHVVELEDARAAVCGFALRGGLSQSHFRAIAQTVRTPELQSLAGAIVQRWTLLRVEDIDRRIAPAPR